MNVWFAVLRFEGIRKSCVGGTWKKQMQNVKFSAGSIFQIRLYSFFVVEHCEKEMTMGFWNVVTVVVLGCFIGKPRMPVDKQSREQYDRNWDRGI
jgi:hypothetical protein